MTMLDVETIAQKLRKHPEVLGALIFGSYVKPDQVHNESDIDIAIVLKSFNQDSSDIVLAIQEELSIICAPVFVDVVDLNTADPILAHQIFKQHRILFDPKHRIPTILGEQLVKYLDFKMVRSVIEKNIGKKKYYG